jgi:predicted RNA-binding protein YlxR (DUF448 family)
VVRRPDGSVVTDPTGRLSGRGAYVCGDLACRRTLASPRALARALGVSSPMLDEALAGQLDTTLIQEGTSGTK